MNYKTIQKADDNSWTIVEYDEPQPYNKHSSAYIVNVTTQKELKSVTPIIDDQAPEGFTRQFRFEF